MPRFLIAFDFDHTVVDGNSDTWVYRCLPGQVLPPEVKAKYEHNHWTEFMNQVFLHMSGQGISKQQMEEVLATIPLAPGMQELLEFLAAHASSFDSLIASDANDFFIRSILAKLSLTLPGGGTMPGTDLFSHVFTNTSQWLPSPTQGGAPLLHIDPPHTHTCPRCSTRNPNMCKRTFLIKWIQDRKAEGIEYDGLMYVGDGGNDYCPCSMLAATDHAFVRWGMVLHKELITAGYLPRLEGSAGQEGARPAEPAPAPPPEPVLPTPEIKANIVVWKSALEIKQSLEKALLSATRQ